METLTAIVAMGGQPRTVVYQSFRRENVPSWISRSMETVRNWAKGRNYDYVFIDDALFGYVPDWYRLKANGDILLVSDLARLNLAREFLSRGYERTIWIDADVLVFHPGAFDVGVTEGFAFSPEVWLHKSRWYWLILDTIKYRKISPYFAKRHVANFVTVFTRQTPFLDFYIDACQQIVRCRESLTRWDVGTKLLTVLHSQLQFPLVAGASLFSPFLLKAIEFHDLKAMSYFMAVTGQPIYAANLCASKTNETYDSVRVTEQLFHRVADELLQSRGGILNNLLDRGSYT